MSIADATHFFLEGRRAHNASKISIVYLAAFLKQSGFRIIDTQFYSEHLRQFGTIEISQSQYLDILKEYSWIVLKKTKVHVT